MKNRSRWSTALRNSLRTMWQIGWSVKTISQALRMSEESVMRQLYRDGLLVRK